MTEGAARERAGSTAPSKARPPVASILRGSSLPARWRITGWIVLTTLIALIAVTITARSIFASGVDVAANEEIEQEVDEFATFATTGRDPETAGPFTSADRLLEIYLARQIPNNGEVIVGVLGDTVTAGDPRTGVAGARVDALAADGALIDEMTSGEAISGSTVSAEDGPVRWARADFIIGEQTGALLVVQYTDAARDEVDAAIVTIAWVAFGGLLLSSVIAWLVAGQILAPIREVRRVARDITENDLTARVPVRGRDDIAEVAETFNAMLDRIAQAYTTQRQFVDDASHELRTPITVVRGHLELLDCDPATREHSLRLADQELVRMARIVSDLLMLARADQPHFVTPAPVELSELTLDIEAKSQTLGDRRWLLMEVAEGGVRLDGQRVTQAMLQLAANAVQYTDAGDSIRLGSRLDDDADGTRVRFWVEDEGPGVKPEEASQIFERFRHGAAGRLPTDQTGQQGQRGGAGLGLAIVRAIADGHGGRAWLESTPGHGAKFGIEIPVTVEPTRVLHSAAGSEQDTELAETQSPKGA